MPNLKRIRPPGRYRGEAFNRTVNSLLRQSAGFGSSFGARGPVILAAMKARMANPKALIAYVPPVPKIARVVAPGIFGKRKDRRALKPCKAEVETILESSTSHSYSGSRLYVRMSNGEIRKSYGSGVASLVVFSAGSNVVLKPEDIKLLPKQPLPYASN